MSNVEKKRGPIWKETPFLTGVVITTLVLFVAVASLGLGEVCNVFGSCVSKWETLKTSRPNEIGDSLAGFAGTLAFVWLIVTVWLQATELREQREEFEKIAEAQEAQVDLLVEQGKIFADEQRERAEQRTHRELYKRLELARNEIARLCENQYSVAWLCNLIPLNRDETGHRRGHSIQDQKLFNTFSPTEPVENAFFLLEQRTKKGLDKIKRFIGPRKLIEEKLEPILECLSTLDKVLALKKNISPEDQIQLEILGIKRIYNMWVEKDAIVRGVKK